MEKVIQTLGTLTSKLFGILQLDKVNSIIQADKINSTVDEAEGKVSTWVALIYDLASIAFLAFSVWTFISIFKDDMLSGGDGKASIGILVGGIIWLYAAFPLMSVIRRTADSLRAPGESLMSYFFKDFVVANIKMLGQLTAIVALFGALTMLLGWATDIAMLNIAYGNANPSGLPSYAGQVQDIASFPVMAVTTFLEFIGVESIKSVIEYFTTNNWLASHTAAGEAQSAAGLVPVLFSFASVILILVQVYISIAIYTFFYGIATSFMNWVKSPYLPMKSL